MNVPVKRKHETLKCIINYQRHVYVMMAQSLLCVSATYDYSVSMYQGPISHRHDDVTKWKHFPCNWPFVRGIHFSPVNSPHNGQWRGAPMFSLICVWINDLVNAPEADDLRCYRTHYDITIMSLWAHNANLVMLNGVLAWEIVILGINSAHALIPEWAAKW